MLHPKTAAHESAKKCSQQTESLALLELSKSAHKFLALSRQNVMQMIPACDQSCPCWSSASVQLWQHIIVQSCLSSVRPLALLQSANTPSSSQRLQCTKAGRNLSSALLSPPGRRHYTRCRCRSNAVPMVVQQGQAQALPLGRRHAHPSRFLVVGGGRPLQIIAVSISGNLAIQLFAPRMWS